MTTYGYKAWSSGQTFNAEDAMKYLMKQAVTIWETINARDIDTTYTGSLVEGNLCFIQSTSKLYYYTGSAWEPIASQDYVDTASATIEDVFVMLYMETI